MISLVLSVPLWKGLDLSGKHPASYLETCMVFIYLDTEKDKLKLPTLSQRTTAKPSMVNGYVVVPVPVAVIQHPEESNLGRRGWFLFTVVKSSPTW